ncbi:9802_t:CDS:2 [Dentiscutata erythropus]|uniref:9802_t:CDS:1 n=1 Tax=Dentiscutata erythropus TaxID=1348616 RepID=A0A9N8WI23_9GLOM|nr:9802_t:CDS:2 [Dentiscutata erythropus]
MNYCYHNYYHNCHHLYWSLAFIIDPSSLVLHQLSFIVGPSSLVLYHQSFIHRYQGASRKVSPKEKNFYMEHLWKSQSLSPSDKKSTRIQNKIPLCNLLAGVLIRECTRNYLLKLSDISLDHLMLIISNIIIKNVVNWNTEEWNSFRNWFNLKNCHEKGDIIKSRLQYLLRKKWDILLRDFSFNIEHGFIKIEDNLTVSELELKSSAKSKYGLARQNLSDQLNDNNFDNYNEIHSFDDNNNSNNFDDICLLDDEDNNSYNSYPSENDNSDNYSDNIYLFEDNNNSGYSDFSEDNNNNSDYSDLSEDDNNNNSDYSDLSEDDNNSDYSNLFEDDNNSDVEMDISEETNFKNITSLMMFTWITKHMIGNRTYKDLVNIINNENFNPIDVPKNIQTLKEQQKHLPLHKIRKNIEILYKKPGTEATWITRHIKFRHFLPLEYIQEPKNSKDLSIKKLRRQYNLLKSVQEKKDFVTRHGISIQPSPFSYLKFNPFQQIPQDAYHAVSGKIVRLMEITIDLLSESGKKLFIKNWKYFEFPSTWSKMPSPTSHSRSHFMSDYQ